MATSQKQTVKKIVSWTIGVPAFIVAFGEANDFNYWWLPIVGMGVLILVLKWNHAFNEQQSTNRRVN